MHHFSHVSSTASWKESEKMDQKNTNFSNTFQMVLTRKILRAYKIFHAYKCENQVILRVDFTIMNAWVQTEMCLVMLKHKFAGCWIVRFHYLIIHYHLNISSSKLMLPSGSNCKLCYYFAGNCTDYTGAYRCTCDPGYRGLNCTENIDECESSPCAFGELSKISLILYHPCKQTVRFL